MYGVIMPILGIGTFSLSDSEAEESVYWALRDGYRLIDTAQGKFYIQISIFIVHMEKLSPSNLLKSPSFIIKMMEINLK